jgi:uncharacterized membrane protein
LPAATAKTVSRGTFATPRHEPARPHRVTPGDRSVDFCLLESSPRHPRSMKQILIPTLLLILAACGSNNDADEEEEEEELPPVIDCSTVRPVPTFAEVTAFQNVCTNCHVSTKTGSARNGAPSDINFDQYASANSHANQAAIEVNVGAMPPEGSGFSLTAAQKTTLFDWAMCGAPQ